MKTTISAFSLIEMSIVLIIISILITGSLVVTRGSINNSQSKITQDRINEIYKAMNRFVAYNRRLPCPAPFTNIKTDAAYGTEGTTPGTCTGALTSSSATNLVYGMIPIKALGLTKDLAEDGYETRFSYIVDKRFTKATAINSPTDGFEFTQGNPSPSSGSLTIIDVKTDSTSGADLLTYALFVIISHGPNKLGGYPNNSGTQNSTTGITTDENTNIYAANFDTIFVTNSTTAGFDDVLFYRGKTQIAMDSGMEFMICPQSESNRSATTCASTSMTWTTSAYTAGTAIPASVSCATIGCSGGTPTRYCDKFGVWSSISGDCS